MEFYATAAQVIPTLFIAMAFGGGILASRPNVTREREQQGGSRWFSPGDYATAAIYVVAFMILGEICALVALALGQSKGVSVAGVWVGLAAGLVGVALPVVRAHWTGLSRGWSRFGMGALLAMVTIGLVVIVVAMIFVAPRI